MMKLITIMPLVHLFIIVITIYKIVVFLNKKSTKIMQIQILINIMIHKNKGLKKKSLKKLKKIIKIMFKKSNLTVNPFRIFWNFYNLLFLKE